MITTDDAAPELDATRVLPKDVALLMKDGFSFNPALNNPKKQPPVATERWRFVWGADQVTRVPNSRTAQYWPHPNEYTWNGHWPPIVSSDGDTPGQGL